jgi:tRNA(Arg) A34 adenosine deaminase TadA
MPKTDHEAWMRLALVQAQHVPALPFGAVLVDPQTQTLLAQGYNRTGENPTYHGEIVTLNEAVACGTLKHPERLILYTTAEPCPLCMGAVLWAGIGTVVYGTSIATLIRLGWKQIDIPAEELANRCTGGMFSQVIGGCLEAECDALFQAVH